MKRPIRTVIGIGLVAMAAVGSATVASAESKQQKSKKTVSGSSVTLPAQLNSNSGEPKHIHDGTMNTIRKIGG